MKLLIYLDQNVLSDLRDRKLYTCNKVDFEKKYKSLIEFKYILKKPNIDVLYSDVTIEEIAQIKNDKNYNKHFLEHYQALAQLDAKFIDIQTKEIIDKKPHLVALERTKNKKESYKTPYPYLEQSLLNLVKNQLELPTDKSASENHEVLHIANNEIFDIAILQLKNIGHYEYVDFLENEREKMNKALSVIKDNLDTKYNIKQYRSDERIKKIMDNNPTISDLIQELEKRWDDEMKLLGSSSIFNTIVHKINFAYTQLNFIGYKADDFTKVTKNKDRFNSSFNDMRHASSAYISDFLISSDKKFIEKTKICYKFANVKTIACTVDEFLEKYSHIL